MASSPVLNPDIPYVGEVDSGLMPGKMLKIQGKTPPNAVRFAINYQLGPNLNPRDDIAIHISPRFPEGFITRNHIESMNWGPEENGGPMWIQPGEDFEIIVLCEALQYKIAVNGKHFTEFAHRLPYQRITHLVIDGDVEVKSIVYEIINSGPPRSPHLTRAPDVPVPNYGPPAPGGLYPTLGPQGLGPAGGGMGGGYGPPPDAYGAPDGGYNPPRAYGYQPGHEKAEEEDAFGGCLDKVGLAVGGLIAAGGVAAAMHAINKNKKEHEIENHEKTDSKAATESEGGLNLGALGAALASSLASSALQGDTRPQSGGYPPHDSGAGGVLGSIFGALGGGGGGSHQPQGYYPSPQQPSDPLGGALGSILGGVLGGGGGGAGHQQPGGYGGYQPSGGYGSQQQGSGGGGDLLSGLGSALGSSLLSSALDGLTKHKSEGHDDRHSGPPPSYYGNYGDRNNPPPPTHQPPPQPSSPPASGGAKFSAADISKGLGLDDDEN
ncbi:spidroin-2-like [Venturia canescens]|uniref:spidroin-2-like n=1 Tax=Venturia canescens TaxID=32260 RepID=UPI001C9D4F13|nr:spidroin-2-like [Venturia canescens]